jgi:type I restriction enzyme M protein
MGQEGKIRQHILEMDILEAVIGLGPNLFYGTGLAACILVFRTKKQTDRQGKVLMVDASKLYRKGRNQNTLEPEHSTQIHQWYCDYLSVEGAVQLVTLDEIAANDWNLNIPRYVEPLAEEETITVEEALTNLKNALEEAYFAEERLKELLRDAGLMDGH